MINTYQTSLAAPPVPPRLNRSNQGLFAAPLPSSGGHSKSLIRFLVGVALLHLFLTVVGFIYLYQRNLMAGPPSAEGKASYRASEKQEASYKILARMAVKRPDKSVKSTPDYLQWDIGHSTLRSINYYHDIWLTINQPGDYYVYSRVTFSKGDPKRPLASRIKLKKNLEAEEKTVTQAFCNLDSHSGSAEIPRMCTASQGEVISLEKGNQLSVWVQDLSLVNYEDGSTTFGMYKL
ncbi:CD40 ligand [Sparus aurata]|uniref:CD40 ligand n=1 Tax=Sparus aurata TaxID=8175 RepID=A0A671UZ35_SPAAU|nr:tumor necrosis factor ligand superfamily member 6-like [Sparus aurata]